MTTRFKTYSIAESKQISLLHHDIYSIREPNRLVSWLVRLLKHFCILNEYFIYEKTYNSFEINFDNVIKAIFESQQVVDNIAHKKGKYLIVGRDHYYKIISGDFKGYLQFQLPKDYDTRINPVSAKPYFIGLEIIMVPWIDGFFVLPEFE